MGWREFSGSRQNQPFLPVSALYLAGTPAAFVVGPELWEIL
jgi:hypothetical protein